MKLTTKIHDFDGTYNFDCYSNTTKIEIGDYYLFSFCGEWFVSQCISVNEQYEINPNDRLHNSNKIDLVTGFWKVCYKIKSTDFDLTKI